MTPDERALDCRHVVQRLWDYLDGRLDAAELAAIDAHLADCERCPPHFAFERSFLRALRAARREHDAPEALRAHVAAALAAAGFVPGAARRDPGSA
jgi:anti-sigma factor (TIGR02949 family)